MDKEGLQALNQAVERLATLLSDYGVSEDEVVSAFRARRVQAQDADPTEGGQGTDG